MWIDDINYCILLFTTNVFLFIPIYERGADNVPGGTGTWGNWRRGLHVQEASHEEKKKNVQPPHVGMQY